MSTSWIIYNNTTKKLSNFKNVHDYTSHYQVPFDKVVSFLIEISSYTYKSTEMNIQATIFMNIRVKYSALVSIIQKDWKDENINLAEAILQIIRHF